MPEIIHAAPVVPRPQLALTAQGLTAATWERLAENSGATILVDGRVEFICVGLRAGDVVTNLLIAIDVAGVTMTLSKVGLYDKTGTRLAVSADQGAGWASTGLKTIAVATPYTVPIDDGYYVAIVGKATTLPRPASAAFDSKALLAVGSGMAPLGIQTGQTDLPSSATITFSGTGNAYWVGVS